MNTDISKSAPYIKLALGAITISFSAVFVQLTTTPPSIDAFYRALFGGIILLIIALIRREKLWQGWQPLFYCALLGFLFAADLVIWHQGINYIGPGLATIILNLQVFILAFVGVYFYRDEWNWKFLLAIPTALLGLYLLVGYEWNKLTSNYKLGIFLCLFATIFYSSYLLILHRSRALEHRLQPFANLAQLSLFCALFSGLAALVQHQSFFTATPEDWIWLVLYGIFGQVLGWLLISMGIGHTKLSLAGFLLLLQPSLAFLWDIVIFKRTTPTIQIIGAGVTLFAIYLSSTARKS